MKPLRLSFAQICERCGETSGGLGKSLRMRFGEKSGGDLARALFMRQKHQSIGTSGPAPK